MKTCSGSMKENQERKVNHTCGVLAFILNCGIIVSLHALPGVESLTQVYVHTLNLYDAHRDVLPNRLAYDNGCNLRKFAENETRRGRSEIAKWFWNNVGMHIVVDRLHFRNHKKSHAYCQKNCNPDSKPELVGVNTEICEQSFKWFNRHSTSANQMSPARFMFFLLYLADRRNGIICELRSSGMEVDEMIQEL